MINTPTVIHEDSIIILLNSLITVILMILTMMLNLKIKHMSTCKRYEVELERNTKGSSWKISKLHLVLVWFDFLFVFGTRHGNFS